MNPRVSILMAAYNCEDYVSAAIESILDQTFTDWEIVVADDGSTDKTRQVIDRFLDKRIRRFHNEKNRGLLYTWNHLLEQARGQYLTWQDADDLSLPQRLQKQVDALYNDPELMLCGCNYVRHFPAWGMSLTSCHPSRHADILHSINEYQLVPFTGATKMIKREILPQLKGFRPFFNGLGWEDFDFILRTAELYKVANIPDVLYVYRYNRGSSSRRLDQNSYLKIYMNRIGFFLARQRQDNQGLDGLMQGGDRPGLDDFLEKLKNEFEADPSVLYRVRSLNRSNNFDFEFALKDALLAVSTGPLFIKNYLLFIRVLLKMVKVFVRWLLLKVPGLRGNENDGPF